MQKKKNMGDEKSFVHALTVQDVDFLLKQLSTTSELAAYRKSLEFYKERLLEQQREYLVQYKRNALLSSSVQGDYKAYNRRG